MYPKKSTTFAERCIPKKAFCVSQPPPAVRLSPHERVADAGEDSVEAQPNKDALKKAREQTRVQPVERLSHSENQKSRIRIERMQSDLSREQSLLQGALENLERLRDEGARPSAQMVVEDPGRRFKG